MLNTSKLTVLQPIRLWVGIVFFRLFLTSNCPCVRATNTQWLYCGSINSASHATAIWPVSWSNSRNCALMKLHRESPRSFKELLFASDCNYLAIYKCHLLAKTTVGREKERHLTTSYRSCRMRGKDGIKIWEKPYIWELAWMCFSVQRGRHKCTWNSV